MPAETEKPHEPGTKYIFFRDEWESQWTTVVHTLITPTVYGGRLIYDRNVEIGGGNRVLDAGTGSGCWLLDLSKEVPESVDLYGVDTYDGNFAKSYPPNVHLDVASVTKLPQEWSGTFDFVNERLLGVGVLREEWPTVLSELYRVLKPGGSIQLVEYLSEAKNKGPAWTRVLAVLDELFAKRGLIPDCPLQLPSLLKAAGFVDLVAEEKYIPIGQAGGEPGKLAGEHVINGFRNLMHAIKEEGIKLSKSEMEAMMERARKEWDGPEPVLQAIWIVHARKPA